MSENNKDKEDGLFFLDSGAHSIYTKHVIKKGHREGYAYYDTKDFWKYVDRYAAFVRKYKRYIDYYANVDVIFDPARSWKVLQYLEKEHGLQPVPVIHYGTPLYWIEKHLETGKYDLLGLGGLGQEATAGSYRKWADAVFSLLCPPPSYLPVVRTHGFAMTAYGLLIRYPWWSTDSATWSKVGAFGNILVPHKRQGKFTFDENPYMIAVSFDSSSTKKEGKHYLSLNKAERKIVMEWLEEVQVPLGKPLRKVESEDEIEEFGVVNRHSERKKVNLLFFEKMRLSLPKYPWPFKIKARKGFWE